jgi:preprotein translocase subunit SecB
MNAQHLQLESYLIDRLSIEALETYDDSKGRLDIRVDPTVFRHKDDELARQLLIDVKFGPAEAGSAPYSGRVVGRAFFRLAEGLDEKTSEQYVLFNGSAILYGLLRAQVCQVTALGPWGTLLLPPVNLVEMFSTKAGARPKASRPRAKAAAKKTSATKVRKSGSKAAVKANAARTPEARSEASRKANVSRGAAGRSAAAKKAAATRATRTAKQGGQT